MCVWKGGGVVHPRPVRDDNETPLDFLLLVIVLKRARLTMIGLERGSFILANDFLATFQDAGRERAMEKAGQQIARLHLDSATYGETILVEQTNQQYHATNGKTFLVEQTNQQNNATNGKTILVEQTNPQNNVRPARI